MEEKHILALLKDKKRLDSRDLFDFRSIEIEIGVIEKAEGSAKVKLGDTTVIAGVKGQIGEPFPDTPNHAVQIVNMELSPIASPFFEPGPPQKDAIELARVVDRGIRESKAVNLEDPNLVIKEGENVWILFVDVYVIDNHGNLFDASILAAMAALAHAKLPKVEITDDGTIVKSEDETVPIPLNRLVASITFGKVGDYIIIDPSIDEERCMNARFTVAITDDDSVCSMQKGLAGMFSVEEIFEMLDIAKDKVPTLISYLKSE